MTALFWGECTWLLSWPWQSFWGQHDLNCQQFVFNMKMRSLSKRWPRHSELWMTWRWSMFYLLVVHMQCKHTQMQCKKLIETWPTKICSNKDRLDDILLLLPMYMYKCNFINKRCVNMQEANLISEFVYDFNRLIKLM